MNTFSLILMTAILMGNRNDSALNPTTSEFSFLKAGNEWHFRMKTSQTPTPLEVIYKILLIRDDGYIEVENSFAGIGSEKIYWYADKTGFSEIASPEDNFKLTLVKVNPVLNDTWSSSIEEEGKTMVYTRTVVSLNESIQLRVDYVVELGNGIVPIEVKSGIKGKMQSLRIFMEEKKCKFGIRTSFENFDRMGNINIVPLYAIGVILKTGKNNSLA